MRRLAYNPTARYNPSTGTWIAIATGVVVVGGLIGYGLYRRSTTPTFSVPQRVP